jgi:hypothetical protein
MEETSSAAKTRSDRPGWSVIFGHPLRRDAPGKLGLKFRRRLNRTDDYEAGQLVGRLNIPLSDRKWRSEDRRGARDFVPQVVSAFFDGIAVGRYSSSITYQWANNGISS